MVLALLLSPLLGFAAGFVLHRLMRPLHRSFATPMGREDFYQAVTPNLSLGLTCAHRME